MSELCTITPISAFMSTNLNSKIQCYQELGQRILRLLGHPMINVELHPDQLYDSISMACEFFTKYAGYTKEFLIFNSQLYEHNKGIRLDHLFTVANSNFTISQKLSDPEKPNPDFDVKLRENLYVCLEDIPKSYFANSSELSAIGVDIEAMQVIDESIYNKIVDFDYTLASKFKLSPSKKFNIQCEPTPQAKQFNNIFDYDIMDYRKVIDVVDFEEGSTSGITTLFSMEATLAQQTFYSYSMGNFGFDLLSWHVVKDWVKTREKVLSIKRDVQFDSRTQYLRFIPQPRQTTDFVGVIQCYVERPLRDIVKEKWVLEYATALAKVMWGRILTKVNNVNLLGGGTLNGNAILTEGLEEKKNLETFLIEGGFGDFDPVGMYLG